MNHPINPERHRETLETLAAQDASRASEGDTCGLGSIRPGRSREFLSALFCAFAIAAMVLPGSVLLPCLAQTPETFGLERKGQNGLDLTTLAGAASGGGSSGQLDPRPASQEDAKSLEAAINNAIQLAKAAQGLTESGNLDQGETKIREALAAYDRLPDTNAMAIFGHANCYVILGTIANKRGDEGQALKWWQKAVHLYEKLQGESAVGNLVSTLELMAQVLTKAEQTEDALTVLRKLDDIQEGADPAVRALNKSNVGVMLHRLGREHEAEKELQEAVTLSGLGDSKPEEKAEFLSNLGLTEQELRHTKSAILHFRESLRLIEGIEHKEESRAETMTALAQALIEEGDREGARAELTSALDAIKDKPELRELKAKILLELARALPDETAAQKGAAVKTLREALSLVEGQAGLEEIQVACTENLGLRLQQMGNLEEAIRIYQEVIAKLVEKPSRPTNSQLGPLYNNLGIYLLDGGRASEALDSLLLGMSHYWAELVDQLPSMTQRETMTAATQVARRANLIYSIALSSPKTMAPRAYGALLLTKALYSEASRTRQQILFHAGPPTSSAARERYIELRRRISRRTLDSDHSEVPVSNEAMKQLAREADRLELDLLRVSRDSPGAWGLEPVRPDQVWSRLKPGEVLVDYFTFSSMDLKTQKELGRRYGAFVVHAGGTVEVVDLGEAKTVVGAIEAFRDCESRQVAKPALDEDELGGLGESARRLILDPALSLSQPPKRLYVAPDGVLGLFPFEALPLPKGSGGWRYLAEDVEVVHLMSGRELVRSSVSGSPSSEVWLFGDPDFDATPNQRVAAFNNPSRSDSASLPGNQGSGLGQTAVLMGGPQETDETETAIPGNWQAMHDTRLIINTAAEQASKAGLKTRILVGAEASEENLSRVRAPRVMMFATHGYFMKKMPPVHAVGSLYFNSSSESLTAVSRADVAPGEKVNGIVVDNDDFWQTFDPLQRSMMILAGANHRVHHVVRYLVNDQLLSPEQSAKLPTVGQGLEREIGDGLLTAYEVIGLDLAGTDLVVLAGCESGLGVTTDSHGGSGFKQESESVVGLRQALAIAGARSVVTSMWDVPLDGTVDQINDFLHGWMSGGLPRYQAFHASQLRELAKARENHMGGHPFWWAGFVYFGDPGDR